MSTYAFSDIHGNYQLFQKIKDFIKPEDRVYVLGDCGDRGKQGWQIIKEVYESPQFIYIKGNHEDMLVEAMRTRDKAELYFNGGRPTYTDWKYKDGGDRSWIWKLNELPLFHNYVNQNHQLIFMSHAGITPHLTKHYTKDDYLWGRNHFWEKWDTDFNDVFVIHGHTPVSYMDLYINEKIPKQGVLWYCPDEQNVMHKCDIDCDTFATNSIALLDLDTFEQHIFEV